MQGADDEETSGHATSAAVLRSSCRTARRGLDDQTRARADTAIVEHLLALPELSGATRVGWYLSTDGEVDLTSATARLRATGAQLLLPVVGAAGDMAFVGWAADDAMRANRYGIGEPAHDGPRVPAVELDAVVVPCVAVDPHGHRLGFGAGYYDRALAGAPAVARVGVVFEVQVVEQLHPAPWDVPLDVVVTERRVLRPDADDPGGPGAVPGWPGSMT